jgi:hypothetical protein
MNDLFPVTAAAAESLISSRFRVHPIVGDAMEPALRGGRDYVLAAPITSYAGEGIYLLNVGLGIDLYRVTTTFDGKGGLRLSRDNQRYQSHDITRERFEESVVGIVVADIKTRDDRFLRGAREEGRL